MGEVNRERIGPRSRLFLLSVCGLVIFACFALLISMALDPTLRLLYNVKGATYGGPLTWLGRWLNLAGLSHSGSTILYVCLMVVLTLAYLGALYLVRDDGRVRITVIIAGGFLLFALLFVFIPPLLSRDIYSYAFGGRSITVYHANPYLLKPVSHPNDVLYPLIGWRHQPSVYGPIFNYLSFIVCKVAGNNIAANVLGFKVLAFLFYAASLPLVYALARRVSPGRENLALAIAAWNPLLLLHILGAGHNDPLMFFFVLLGLYLCRLDYPVWGLVSVVLAVMVKATAALALLPYLVFFLRGARGKLVTRVLEAGAAVIVLPVLLYLPFWKGFRIFDATRRLSGMVSYSSVPTLAKDVLRRILSGLGIAKASATSLSNTLVHLFFLALLAAIVLALLWKVRDYRTMVLSTGGILLALFLTSGYILPWYLGLGLMVCAISGWNATTGSTVAASCVFLLYRIPITQAVIHHRPLLHVSYRPVFYLSIPLAVILITWLILGKPFSGLRRASPGGETTG